jgi:hypothetical protein
MMTLLQVTPLSTGNPRLDAIGQVAVLCISVLSIAMATFGKKQGHHHRATPPRKRIPARAKVVITDEAIDEANSRR